MKVLGITGGVGSGKTTVLDYLDRMYGARIIQADQAAHFLQEPGQDCYDKITEAFGEGILNEDYTINREKLSGIVFGDRQKLEKLNKLVHPAVKEYIVSEIKLEKERKKVPFLVIEAALLIEDRYDEICDNIWYVFAPEEVRIQRLCRSRGYSRGRAKAIMRNQLTEEAFRLNSQFVVDNSTDIVDNTYEQIDRGLKKYEFL